MKTQYYYTNPPIYDPGVRDLTVPLRIVSSGIVSQIVIPNPRVRLDWYLLYILSGSLKISINGEIHTLVAGNVVVISAGTKHFHHTEKDNSVKYLWIHFTGSNIESTLEHFKLNYNTPLYAGVHHSMNEYWQRLFNTFILNDDYFQDVSSAILTEIFAQFSRFIHSADYEHSFLNSISYMHKNYSSNIKISELAEMENLSETRYRAIFKKMTGISPSEYIMNRRIEIAVKLLENTNLSISDIAIESGYSDVFYFIRVFKKKTGITPAKYRKMQHKKAPTD